MSAERHPWFSREGLALLTDFYQLTMMAGHWKDGRTDNAYLLTIFSAHCRNIPGMP